MKKLLTNTFLIVLATVSAGVTDSTLAQSGVNRQRAGQGNPPIVRPNKQGKVPPVLRGKGPLGGLPGATLPGVNSGRNNPRGNQQQFRRQQLMQALALTPDQRLKMAQIRQRHEEDAIVVGRRLRQARQSLDRALYGEEYNEALIRRLTEDLVAAQSEQIRLQARMNSEIRSVMTAEQVRRFRQKERELKQEQRRRQLLNDDDRPPDPDKDKQDREDDEEDLASLLFR